MRPIFTSSRGAESFRDRHHGETRVGHVAAAMLQITAGGTALRRGTLTDFRTCFSRERVMRQRKECPVPDRGAAPLRGK